MDALQAVSSRLYAAVLTKLPPDVIPAPALLDEFRTILLETVSARLYATDAQTGQLRLLECEGCKRT